MGCSRYPLVEINDKELDVTTTFEDNRIDYSQYNTYAINDSILLIYINERGKIDTLEPKEDVVATITSGIREQMDARGYTEVSVDQDPDLGFDIGLIDNLSVDIVYYNYWPSYWGCLDCYYYYPWSWTSISSTEQGTMIIVTTDRTSVDANTKEIPAIWSSVTNGYLDDTRSIVKDRIATSIQQSFDQSSYFSK